MSTSYDPTGLTLWDFFYSGNWSRQVDESNSYDRKYSAGSCMGDFAPDSGTAECPTRGRWPTVPGQSDRPKHAYDAPAQANHRVALPKPWRTTWTTQP